MNEPRVEVSRTDHLPVASAGVGAGAGHLPAGEQGRLKLGRRDFAAGRMEATLIPPVDPARRGQLDISHRTPAPLAADELGLVQLHRFGHPVERRAHRVAVLFGETLGRLELPRRAIMRRASFGLSLRDPVLADR